MTSRLGSVVVATFLAVVTVLAVVLIFILINNDSDAADSTVLIPSLRDGDLVLLGEPVEILVTAQDAEPITAISLLINGGRLATQAPVANAVQGTFSTTFTWTPERLGPQTLRFETQTVSGTISGLEISVETTNDAERVRSTLRVVILSPLPFQQVPRDSLVSVLVQGRGRDPIVTFTLDVNGQPVDEQSAELSEGGDAIATLSWTPQTEGRAVLRISGRTAGGAAATADINLEVVAGDDDSGPAQDAGAEQAAGAPIEGAQTVPGGFVTIKDPSNGANIPYADGLRLDVDIQAHDTGHLSSLELYVNGVLLDSFEPQPLGDGSYRLTIPFQPPEAGEYTLEIVAFNDAGQRFDDRIEINLVAEAGAQEQAADPATALPDLFITTLNVGEANIVSVTIVNQGAGALQSTPILISVVRSLDGLLLTDATVTLALAPTASISVQLPLILTEALQITAIVDPDNRVTEGNEDNNQISQLFQPLTRPDFVIQALELSADGFPVVRITNIGEQPFTGQLTVGLLFNGITVETLQFNGTIAAQGSVTLAGSLDLTGPGQLTAVVDPSEFIAEANESNNAQTISIEG